MNTTTPTLRTLNPVGMQPCRGSPAGVATRNFGVAAHVDAGKTTLTECILFVTGATHRMGGVDTGNTGTDWHSIEQDMGSASAS